MKEKRKNVFQKSCIHTVKTLLKHLALYTLPLVVIIRPENKKLVLLLWVLLFQIVYVILAEFFRVRKLTQIKPTEVCYTPPSSKEATIPSITLEKALIERIQARLATSDSFLNPEITIKQLSKELKVSTAELSHYFNHHLHMTFKSYINSRRVEYSIKLVQNNFDKYTIDYIAKESGFQNRTTYYRAFKKLKGVSPTVYYDMHQLKNDPSDMDC